MVRMDRKHSVRCKEEVCVMEDVVTRLREFVENEARSCSMDFGCITPLYVYRMWGGTIPIEDIEKGLTELRRCPETV